MAEVKIAGVGDSDCEAAGGAARGDGEGDRRVAWTVCGASVALRGVADVCGATEGGCFSAVRGREWCCRASLDDGAVALL